MKNFSHPVKLFRTFLKYFFQTPETLRLTKITNQTVFWLREQDLNLRPSGYEPDELPTAPSRVRQKRAHYPELVAVRQAQS